MYTIAILVSITALTIVGDYFIKEASLRENGLKSFVFAFGVLLYAVPAIGWFFLMRVHSLAAIGIFYSASTLILLAFLGYFIFGEKLGLREIFGLSLAVLSVLVISHDF